MKKLVVVLAVVVSGFVNGQTAEELEQYKKACDCDSAMAMEIHNAVVDSYERRLLNKTHNFKTGDNDKAATIGILKDIFTDPNAKFKYEKINPRIAQLQVNGFVLSDTISYSKWIASIPVYDTSKYEIRYELRDNGNRKMEVIDVFDKTTRADIRTILIVYLDNSFYSIFDSSIH
jgi:hypothetical protein